MDVAAVLYTPLSLYVFLCGEIYFLEGFFDPVANKLFVASTDFDLRQFQNTVASYNDLDSVDSSVAFLAFCDKFGATLSQLTPALLFGVTTRVLVPLNLLNAKVDII